jgi:hypothetical protein
MFRSLLSIVTVCLALGIAGSTVAQPPRNPPPNRPPQGVGRPSLGETGGSGPAMKSSSKFLAIPGLYPLSMSSVQRDIGLNAAQKQQLKAVSDGYMASVQQLSTSFNQLGADEKKQQAADFNARAAQAARSAQQKAEAILSPQQVQTVQAIAFQLTAANALANPSVQEKIGLSPEQRDQLTSVFEQAGEKMQQLQRETAREAMQVLGSEQRSALKQQMDASSKPSD